MIFEAFLRNGGVLLHQSHPTATILSRIPGTCSIGCSRSYKKIRPEPKPLPSKRQDWRREQKLPVNPTHRGVLTDGPDFSYTDGRPAPALVNQVRRAEKQRQLMEKIVQLTSEIDLAERLHEERTEKAERQRQRVASSRLKPKATETLDI